MDTTIHNSQRSNAKTVARFGSINPRVYLNSTAKCEVIPSTVATHAFGLLEEAAVHQENAIAQAPNFTYGPLCLSDGCSSRVLTLAM